MKTPQVDKNAGVECLLWNLTIVDNFNMSDYRARRTYFHYVRLKVFDEKGKAAASTLNIEYGNQTSILSIAGRTVKPTVPSWNSIKTAFSSEPW